MVRPFLEPGTRFAIVAVTGAWAASSSFAVSAPPDDEGEPRERRIACQVVVLNERIEAAPIALVGEVDIQSVVGNGLLGL